MDPQLCRTYVEDALGALLDAAERAGGHLNDRPLGEGTNAVGALVLHCCEVCEFWLGHVGLGRASTRDRDAEFVTVTTMADLGRRVEAARNQVARDLDALGSGAGRPSELRQFALGGGSDESLVLYVLKELQQHLGHAECTLDALRSIDAADELGDDQERT